MLYCEFNRFNCCGGIDLLVFPALAGSVDQGCTLVTGMAGMSHVSDTVMIAGILKGRFSPWPISALACVALEITEERPERQNSLLV